MSGLTLKVLPMTIDHLQLFDLPYVYRECSTALHHLDQDAAHCTRQVDITCSP